MRPLTTGLEGPAERSFVDDDGPIRPPREITIRGHAIYGGDVLSSDSAVFATLQDLSDYACFARKLRGQFSIVVAAADRVFAITDFGGSRPVFYRLRGERYRVSGTLDELVTSGDRRIGEDALFFYLTEGGTGIQPFYDGVKMMLPGTVACFSESGVESAAYIDWGEFIDTVPISLDRAEKRFIEIATDYLSVLARGRGTVGCLLSGGTDSVLLAWLLKNAGMDSLAITADYPFKRYSEFPAAAAAARMLGIRHERVAMTERGSRLAFRVLNSPTQNAPCCVQQARMHYQLAERARELGLSVLATGDHADSLFLGFDRYFRSLPHDRAGYARATSSLTAAEKLSRLQHSSPLSREIADVLRIFGFTREQCLEWQQRMRAADAERMMEFAANAPLHTLQQLNGQIWGGVSWQNGFLPPIRALGQTVDFISPFYDLEMIRFALSLPAEFKFRNGETKALLRHLLIRMLGLSLGKRASPNPSRIWRLSPQPSERNAIWPALRPVYDRLYLHNLTTGGKLWGELDRVAALGLWLGRAPAPLAAAP